MRFGMAVNDDFIGDYASRIGGTKGVVYGYFADGEMRAAAELCLIGDGRPADAEGAFSVEHAHQNQGIGTELLGRIIRAARNRGVSRLYMNCLAENHKMQRLCRKYEAELHFDHGEVVGRVLPVGADLYLAMAGSPRRFQRLHAGRDGHAGARRGLHAALVTWRSPPSLCLSPQGERGRQN